MTEAAIAEAPAEPAYDLDKDREARIAEAKGAFGEDVPISVSHGVFLLVAASGKQARFVQAGVDLSNAALAAYFNGRFSTPPEKMVSVYLFSSAGPYDAYCREQWETDCISPYGFYDPTSRRIVMNVASGLATLTHELVHPIVETDFPSAPTWINEGIASLYEQPVMPGAGEIHGEKNWRLPALQKALALPTERDGVTLPRLFSMTDEEFRGEGESLHYAMARYLCQWLDARGKLWPFYQAWRDGVADDPTGEKAFTKTVGKTPAEANAEWIRWVRGL